MLVVKSQQHLTVMVNDGFADCVLAAKVLNPIVYLKVYSWGVRDSLPVRRDKML